MGPDSSPVSPLKYHLTKSFQHCRLRHCFLAVQRTHFEKDLDGLVRIQNVHLMRGRNIVMYTKSCCQSELFDLIFSSPPPVADVSSSLPAQEASWQTGNREKRRPLPKVSHTQKNSCYLSTLNCPNVSELFDDFVYHCGGRELHCIIKDISPILTHSWQKKKDNPKYRNGWNKIKFDTNDCHLTGHWDL